MRRILTGSVLTLALGLLFAASAAAHGWSLHIKPRTVPQGGSVTIWTTARARSCALTMRVGHRNYRYRLDRGRTIFSLTRNVALGRARVTVRCEGLVKSGTFRVVPRPGKHPAPTPPPASQPPPVAPTVPALVATPVTVYNVCHAVPGLGTHQKVDVTINGQIWPTLAWTDSSGQLALLLAATPGSTTYDIAVIPTAADRSVVAYFARCTWPNWVTVAQWQAAEASAGAGVTAAQAGSISYLQETMPINDSLASTGLTWVTPSVGVSECPTDSSLDCDYEPAPDS